MLRDDQLIVYWMSRIDYENKSGVKSHFHDDLYQLIFIIDGEGYIKINDDKIQLLPSNAYFIAKNDIHSFHFNKPSSTIDIKFKIISNELENKLKENVPSNIYINNSLKIRELLKLSVLNLKSNDPIIPYRIDILFKDFLLSLIQEKTFVSSQLLTAPTTFDIHENKIEVSVLKYLNKNLASQISLKEIANHFNYHPHYIIELFKKRFKTTPMNFLQNLRLEKAKEYLEFSNYNISEISSFVGWSTPYFSRLFKSVEGVSPTIYREQTRTIIGKHILLEEDFFPSLGKQPKILKYNNF